MVAEVTRDEKGKITERHLPQNKFHQAAQNESLEEVAKRLNLKPENLEYVIQIEPDTKGKSEFVVLKDAKASGSFKRASDNAVDELKEINYRFFGTDEISDPVFIAQKKLEAKTRDEIIEPRLAKIKEQIEATYHYEQKLKELNEADNQSFNKDPYSFEPNPKITEIEEEYNKK